MFAICPNHKIVRIKRQRKTCPDCGEKLRRARWDELQAIAESAMDRARAARAIIASYEHSEHGREMKLAAFMSIFEGKNISSGEAKRMLA